MAIAATPARRPLADFLELTKPRLNFLVIVTTAVGYYMGVRYAFQWVHFLHALAGTTLTATAASAINQYLERREDAVMRRTENRPLPAHRLVPRESLVFGVALALAGVAYLAVAVNVVTALLGAFSLLWYVLVYTPLKRITSFNTLVGAVSGAIPPLMGWTAAAGFISIEGAALFLILFLWQMPHFLAIAILHREDYRRAGFKMLPVIDGDGRMTSRQIVIYSAALVPASLLPAAIEMAGPLYLVLAGLMSTGFLVLGVACAAMRRRERARQLFVASILYLPLLLVAMMIDKL